MAAWIGLAAALALQATPGAAQEARPEVAVVVVTLDDARQGQIKHGRAVLGSLGHERFGGFRLIEPTIPLGAFPGCEDDSPRFGLEFCARFNLHRALTPDAPPHVVVVFDDQPANAPLHRGADEVRVMCFGRGAEAADPAAQDTWLWPDSARIHGVQDWNRDQQALAACINAALSETPGVPRPRPY
jgi:hypothetical protein